MCPDDVRQMVEVLCFCFVGPKERGQGIYERSTSSRVVAGGKWRIDSENSYRLDGATVEVVSSVGLKVQSTTVCVFVHDGLPGEAKTCEHQAKNDKN